LSLQAESTTSIGSNEFSPTRPGEYQINRTHRLNDLSDPPVNAFVVYVDYETGESSLCYPTTAQWDWVMQLDPVDPSGATVREVTIISPGVDEEIAREKAISIWSEMKKRGIQEGGDYNAEFIRIGGKADRKLEKIHPVEPISS
jgi:hypothetical protein